MTRSPRAGLIIGCGNLLRGDDRIGLLVACVLRARLPGGWRSVIYDGGPVGSMHTWQGHGRVFVIDAAEDIGPPGTLVRFDVTSSALPASLREHSTHTIDLTAAFELARAVRRLPSIQCTGTSARATPTRDSGA